MISKERLIELIEQGATIYVAQGYYKSPIPLGLAKLNINGDLVEVRDNCDREYLLRLENLMENKEDFDFICKYQDITRTETLSLPTFNELQSKRKYFKSFTTNGITHYLVIEMPYKKDNGCILISFNYYDNIHIKFNEPLTKDNYLQACEICRKLFLGEEVEDE